LIILISKPIAFNKFKSLIYNTPIGDVIDWNLRSSHAEYIIRIFVLVDINEHYREISCVQCTSACHRNISWISVPLHFRISRHSWASIKNKQLSRFHNVTRIHNILKHKHSFVFNLIINKNKSLYSLKPCFFFLLTNEADSKVHSKQLNYV